MSLVTSGTKIQMTYICRDENSNDLYLQGRNTYLSLFLYKDKLVLQYNEGLNMFFVLANICHFQMINICNGKIKGLVTSGTKIQMIYIYRDERPI